MVPSNKSLISCKTKNLLQVASFYDFRQITEYVTFTLFSRDDSFSSELTVIIFLKLQKKFCLTIEIILENE